MIAGFPCNFLVRGESNPVLAALKVLRDANAGPLNEQSFISLAVGMVARTEESLFFGTYSEALNYLTKLGDFYVEWDKHGRMAAKRERDVLH